MRLHFIVGKNRHVDITDALRAEEEIQAADVVSFESPMLPLERVIEVENHIKDGLAIRGARRKRAIADMRAQHTYRSWVQAILSENNKPVVFIERHTDKVLEELNAKRAGEKTIVRLITTHMLEGDTDATIQQQYALILSLRDLARYRDIRIGRTGRVIGERIQELYPHLARKETVNYLILLGAHHQAEFQLMQVPNASVSIRDLDYKAEYASWMERACKRVIYDRVGLEGVREDLARVALVACAELVVPDHPSREAVLTKLVEGMHEPDLRQLLSSFPGVAEDHVSQVIDDAFQGKGITLPRTIVECQRMYRELHRAAK